MKTWAMLAIFVAAIGMTACDKDDGGGGAVATAPAPAQPQCYNNNGYNYNNFNRYNGHQYGQYQTVSNCNPTELQAGHRVVNGIRYNCTNYTNQANCVNGQRNCTQAEFNQGFWVDASGVKRVCSNNILNNGFQQQFGNYDLNHATQLCRDAYGPNFNAVIFPGLNQIKCVSTFTTTSMFSYYQTHGLNGYYPTNPYFYGGYSNVYQACRVGQSHGGCHCGNIGGTLGWMWGGISYGICL